MKNRFKWLLAIVLILLCVFLSSCRSYNEAKELRKDVAGGYFTKILEWDDIDGDYWIIYANDTKVKYLIWYTRYKLSIVPLYNADGTLQLYEGGQ